MTRKTASLDSRYAAATSAANAALGMFEQAAAGLDASAASLLAVRDESNARAAEAKALADAAHRQSESHAKSAAAIRALIGGE